MIEIFKKIFFVLGILAVQVLVFNHIHILGYAAPMVYPMLIINSRQGTNRLLLLLMGFAIGLLMDVFSNTPGIAAASLTFLAFVQPNILALVSSGDDDQLKTPSYGSVGVFTYIGFVSICVVLYSVVFFSLEFFTTFNVVDKLIGCGVSVVLSLILILTLQTLRGK